ncbi:phosphoribosylamine--glycine ligase [Synergistaceae bacterium OttesenSCG-928-I11]|nr:phosphoribosylamine--glycine ligase [Synergistaceae bacterium OttesenSCG-928-I11]
MNDKKINVLILGGGGREHAIARSLRASEIFGAAGELHCAPGNPGMEATLHAIDPCDAEAVLRISREHAIGLVVAGPEAPLVAGVGNRLRESGIPFFGPGASGAMLEGSKIFAKNFMQRHGVPTALFDVCETLDDCRAALAKRKPPYVIKADGLAAGKGVFLPDTEAEALAICDDLLNKKILGEAGSRLVIEDFMRGRELTVFAITDGTSYRLLAPSRDHKRAYDGDKGPNTGGMGAYAPVRIPDGFLDTVVRCVLEPTLAGLKKDGIDYRGVLYMGLMILPPDEGETEPYVSVVEYNVRFGDPETQVVLPLYAGDLGVAMLAAAEGRLREVPKCGNDGHALGVVLASGGYPGPFEKNFPIEGLDKELDAKIPGTSVFHSGTKRDASGRIVTAGGRVLTVVGTGATFNEARDRAYERVRAISFEHMHYRNDIGWSEEE